MNAHKARVGEPSSAWMADAAAGTRAWKACRPVQDVRVVAGAREGGFSTSSCKTEQRCQIMGRIKPHPTQWKSSLYCGLDRATSVNEVANFSLQVCNRTENRGLDESRPRAVGGRSKIVHNLLRAAEGWQHCRGRRHEKEEHGRAQSRPLMCHSHIPDLACATRASFTRIRRTLVPGSPRRGGV